MKYKARLRNLEGRRKFFDSMPKSVQEEHTRPGSRNK